MLILFFTIVFIAELIVAGKIISIINQARASVNQANLSLEESKPMIKKGIIAAKNGVTTVTKGVSGVSMFFASKKKEAFKFLIKGIAALVLLIFLKKLPHKKVLSMIDILFALDSFIKLA